MKRIVTLLLAAGLVLGAAAGSQAADIKAKGNWTFTWQLGDNNLFEKNGDKFTAKQRLRTQIDVIASESLKGVLFLEMGDQNWGSSKDGASLGTDGKIVKVRYSYVDWVIPQTDAKVRMGGPTSLIIGAGRDENDKSGLAWYINQHTSKAHESLSNPNRAIIEQSGLQKFKPAAPYARP